MPKINHLSLVQGRIKSRMFRRKHYLALGAAIRSYVVSAPIEDQDSARRLTEAICVILRAEYPTFDDQRFLRLCGLID